MQMFLTSAEMTLTLMSFMLWTMSVSRPGRSAVVITTSVNAPSGSCFTVIDVFTSLLHATHAICILVPFAGNAYSIQCCPHTSLTLGERRQFSDGIKHWGTLPARGCIPCPGTQRVQIIPAARFLRFRADSQCTRALWVVVDQVVQHGHADLL